MKEFDTTHLLDAEVALPFAQKLRSKLEVLAMERRRINDEFGNSIANWRDVLRRGCDLLASRKIGGRFVVERKQDLNPFLTSPEIIRLDHPECLGLVPLDSFCQEFSQKLRYRSVFEIVCLVSFPRPLSVRWMWQHFHPELNPVSHDLAVVLRQGHVVAVKVPAPPLPPGILPPRGNARHKAALSVSLRSDAWVAVVSEQRGETSVACAGELWDVGSSFPEDQNYQVQEDQRRSILMGLGLLWESRQIHSTASGRVHSFKDPWVWDGTAKDQQSGLEKICKHRKSKNGAKEAAEMELRKALQEQGIIWNLDVACAQ